MTKCQNTREIVNRRWNVSTYLETSPDFKLPILLSISGTSLHAIVNQALDEYVKSMLNILYLSKQNDDLVIASSELDDASIQFLDSFIGPHPYQYPRSPANPSSYDVPIRVLTKKCYWADRKIENWSHENLCHPAKILEDHEFISNWTSELIENETQNLMSYLVGLAFERYPHDAQASIPDYEPRINRSGNQSLHPLPRTESHDIYTTDKLTSSIRENMRALFPDSSDLVEQEIVNIVKNESLEEFFGEPNAYFESHLQTYSAHSRYAPIYWPLTSSSGSYTLWLYYHRLHDGILYQCVNDFVDPKLKAVQRQLTGLRGRSRSRDEERELEQLTDLAAELETFRKDLLQLASFWRPNLNDGVEITAAPLHALFGNRKWRDRLAATWGKLQEGEYDWAHLAMSIWPGRVVPQCVADRSLAIAHDIEKLFWVEDNETWRPLRAPDQEKAEQTESRQSEARDRLRDLFAELAAGDEGYLPAMQIWQSLAEGTWDHRPLGLHLFPERAAAAAFDDGTRVLPHLTGHGQKLLQKDTKKNKRLLTKRLTERGTPELAGAVEATLADEPLDFSSLWRALGKGEMDKRPLALELWPERVIGKALQDPDLARQHSLFDFFWYDEPDTGVRRRQPTQREIAHEVERRKRS